jgi:hypothetical protein
MRLNDVELERIVFNSPLKISEEMIRLNKKYQSEIKTAGMEAVFSIEGVPSGANNFKPLS